MVQFLVCWFAILKGHIYTWSTLQQQLTLQGQHVANMHHFDAPTQYGHVSRWHGTRTRRSQGINMGTTPHKCFDVPTPLAFIQHLVVRVTH